MLLSVGEYFAAVGVVLMDEADRRHSGCRQLFEYLRRFELETGAGQEDPLRGAQLRGAGSGADQDQIALVEHMAFGQSAHRVIADETSQRDGFALFCEGFDLASDVAEFLVDADEA